MIDAKEFDRAGFLAGIAALTDGEVDRYRVALLDLYAQTHQDLHRYMINPHAVLSWAAELARHPRILDAVAALIGDDVLLWKSKAFVKFPGPGNVGWHQDLPHWNLEPYIANGLGRVIGCRAGKWMRPGIAGNAPWRFARKRIVGR